MTSRSGTPSRQDVQSLADIQIADDRLAKSDESDLSDLSMNLVFEYQHVVAAAPQVTYEEDDSMMQDIEAQLLVANLHSQNKPNLLLLASSASPPNQTV